MGAPRPTIATPLRNSYWVLPGKVLAGEHPAGATVDATRERLKRLIDAGVECFIDLTEPGEIKAYDAELPFSVEYLRKPIKDHGIPAQRVHMAEILDCLHDTLLSGRCVYVHCRAGIGRTGTVIGCFLAERGFPGDAALDELNRVWQQCDRAQNWPSVPETDHQVDFVRQWKPRAVFTDRGDLATPALTIEDDELALDHPDAPWAHLLIDPQAGARPPKPRAKSDPAQNPATPTPGPAATTPCSTAPVLPPRAGSSATDLPSPFVSRPRSADPGSPPPATVRPTAPPSPASPTSPGSRATASPRSTTAAPHRAASPTAPDSPAAAPAPSAGTAQPFPPSPFVSTPRPVPTSPAGADSKAPVGTPPPAAATAPALRTASPPIQPNYPTEPGDDDFLIDPTSVANIVPDPPRRAPDELASHASSAEDIDPLLHPDALAAAGTLRGRFQGALLGLAIGDAVAAATQYRRPGSFTPVGDMLGGGPFDIPRGGWTDDTAMTLCLADSLIECEGFNARDQVERYRHWQQDGYLSATGQCVGITASSARAIAMAQWRRQAFSGSHDPTQLDPEPLSRVAPVVLFFFANSGKAIDQATEAARTTCQAPAVLEACRSLARALHAALSGQPKSVVLERAAIAINAAPPPPTSAPAAPTAGTTRSGSPGVRGNLGSATANPHGTAGLATAGPVPGGARGSAEWAVPGSMTSGLPDARSPPTGSTAPAALAAAVAAFGATDNFRDAILYAANLGGDSDVVTAVCGQLAGAYYGVKSIPTSWHNSLMRKELIEACADRLLAHAMLGMTS